MKKLILLIVVALALTACGGGEAAEERGGSESSSGGYKVPADSIGVRYGGGFTEDASFKGLIPPGENDPWEWGLGGGDSIYFLPLTQRSWRASSTVRGDGTFAKAEGADRGGVLCVTKDETRMLVDYSVFFYMNAPSNPEEAPDDNIVRQFMENIGFKTNAWTQQGWTDMLRTYFDDPIERLIVEACGSYDAEDLRGNVETRRSFATGLTGSATREVARVVGGNYFCGTDPQTAGECDDIVFRVGRPEVVNQEIVRSEEQKQIAANKAEAQLEENEQITNALQATREEIEALGGPENYVLLEAIRSGNVNFMQLPEGGSVTVPSPSGGGGQ